MLFVRQRKLRDKLLEIVSATAGPNELFDDVPYPAVPVHLRVRGTEDGFPPGQIVDGYFRARWVIVIEHPIAQYSCSSRVGWTYGIFAFDEPTVRLIEICREVHVGWELAIASSDTIDLEGQVYRTTPFLELSGELDRGGTAEALAVDDEDGTIRFVAAVMESFGDESLGYSTAFVLESLGIEVPSGIAKTKSHLADTFLTVIPSVTSTQESHDHAGPFGDGTGRFDVG